MNTVICIGRSFGSDSHEIVVKVTDESGNRFYEKELIQLACRYGAVAEKALQGSDEKATNLWKHLSLKTQIFVEYPVATNGGLIPCISLIRRFSF